MDRSEQTRKALFGFFERKKKKAARASSAKRQGPKPEKLVEQACVAWLKASGFDGQVYEAKAKFIAGRWRSSGMQYGTADWQGVDRNGFAAFVEFKAPGKRSTFWRAGNERQQEYLTSKIEKNAFAVVVDSPELLRTLYFRWLSLREGDPLTAKEFLVNALPARPKRKPEGSYDLGF